MKQIILKSMRAYRHAERAIRLLTELRDHSREESNDHEAAGRAIRHLCIAKSHISTIYLNQSANPTQSTDK